MEQGCKWKLCFVSRHHEASGLAPLSVPWCFDSPTGPAEQLTMDWNLWNRQSKLVFPPSKSFISSILSEWHTADWARPGMWRIPRECFSSARPSWRFRHALWKVQSFHSWFIPVLWGRCFSIPSTRWEMMVISRGCVHVVWMFTQCLTPWLRISRSYSKQRLTFN